MVAALKSEAEVTCAPAQCENHVCTGPRAQSESIGEVFVFVHCSNEVSAILALVKPQKQERLSQSQDATDFVCNCLLIVSLKWTELVVAIDLNALTSEFDGMWLDSWRRAARVYFSQSEGEGTASKRRGTASKIEVDT